MRIEAMIIISPWFCAVNRGKRSIALDLKKPNQHRSSGT